MTTIWTEELPDALTPITGGGPYDEALPYDVSDDTWDGSTSGGYIVVWTQQNLGQ